MKWLRPGQAINKLIEAEAAIGDGITVGEPARGIGVTEQTLYRWRREYRGLRVDLAWRLKRLESENSCLKRAKGDLRLDNQILRDISGPCASPPVDERSDETAMPCSGLVARILPQLFSADRI